MNVKNSLTHNNLSQKFEMWCWAFLIVCLYLFPGQIGLGRLYEYILPVKHVLLIVAFAIFGCIQYLFLSKILHCNLFKTPSGKIIGLYCLFAIYIFFSALFQKSDQIHFYQSIQENTKNIWYIRYAFLLISIECSLVMIGNIDLIFKKIYVFFRFFSILFLAYFFYNFFLDSAFFQSKDCLIRGNGVGIIGCKLLLTEIGLLFFAPFEFKKKSGYYVFLIVMQLILTITYSSHRQVFLGFLSVLLICIFCIETKNKRNIIILALAFLTTCTALCFIAPTAISKIQKSSSYAIAQYTTQDVESMLRWALKLDNQSVFHFSSYRQLMTLLCFVCWQHNTVFGLGYGCFSIAPHNIFFEILGSLGMVGILLFFLPLFTYVFYCGQMGINRKRKFFLLVFFMTFFQNYYTGTYVFNPHLYWVLALGFLEYNKTGLK